MQTLTSQDLDPLAEGVILARADRDEAESRLDALSVDRLACVADIDAEIKRLADQREQRLLEHPNHPLIEATGRDLDRFTAVYRERCEALLQAWHGDKATVKVDVGSVTSRCTKGVQVQDSKAAAEALLKRELWAFVKDIKVDAKGIRPLLDAGGIPGITAKDSYNLSVKVSA